MSLVREVYVRIGIMGFVVFLIWIKLGWQIWRENDVEVSVGMFSLRIDFQCEVNQLGSVCCVRKFIVKGWY